MSSMVTTSQISLSLSYDCESSASLYKVWKVTCNKDLACSCSSTLRLNNRSWRLLNDRLLSRPTKKIDNSYLDLADLLLDLREHYRKPPQVERPPLFSTNSKSTSESRLSLNPYAKKPPSNGEQHFISSGESLNESGEDKDEYSDGGFPGNGTSDESNCNHREDTEGNAFVKDSMKDSQQFELNSHHPNGLESEGKNIFFIANTPSPDSTQARSHLNEVDSKIELASTNEVPGIKRQDSLFGGSNFNSTAAASHISLSSTDISEEDEYTSESEGEEQSHPDSSEIKLAASKASKSQSAGDNDSEWMSVSSESESTNNTPNLQPLNFAKRIPLVSKKLMESRADTISLSEVKGDSPNHFTPRSLLSGLFLNELAHSTQSNPFSNTSLSKQTTSKPILKRSSTTGFITLDKANLLRNKVKLQKPSILFSKRFASLNDVTKNVPEGESVLFVEEENNVEDPKRATEGDHLYTKQASSVSLSNFIVTTHATSSSTNLMTPNSPIDESSHSTERAEALLSSSLNKYSNSLSVTSLKSIFSKSSLQLTSLFGLSRRTKHSTLATATSSENIGTQRYHDLMSHEYASRFSEQGLQSSLSREKSDNVNSPSSSKPNEPKQQTPSKFDVNISPDNDFEPSVEMSQSLKNSILIDHKLGKIPKPERVISAEQLFRGQFDHVSPEDNDDYHSKGW